jgi:hypothetical protein
MLLRYQEDKARAAIEQSIVEGASDYRRNNRIEIAFPAVIDTATKR